MTGSLRVKVNGLDLEYVDEGEGPPVVFSHGGSSDLRYWEPQRRPFAAAYRFVTYSRRYHGQGEWPADVDYSTDAHVDDLVEVIRRLGTEPVHLVGFSTSLALRAAVAVPELLATLTTIEPNVPWLLEGSPEGESVLSRWRSENERVRAEAAGDQSAEARLWFELVNNRGAGTFDDQAPGLMQMWLENFTALRPPTPPPEPLRRGHLRDISLPTLVVGAEYGMPYSRAIVDAISDCIPGARRLILPGVTHFMSYQAPDLFNQAVLAHLDAYRTGR